MAESREHSTRWWFVVIAGVIIAALIFALFVAGGDNQAQAATITEEPADGTTFTVPASAVLLRSTSKICYGWDFAWNNTDGFGRLRFGYGEKVIACTNLAGTKWVSLPTFQPRYWTGYWELHNIDKHHGTLGYSFLDLHTVWQFTYQAAGIPLLHKDRTLTCSLTSSDHNANCTLYYN